MPAEHKTVFISYRRKPAGFTARAIFQDLRAHGYDVFMDVENIDAGDFGTIIDNQIKARVHFLIVLTSGTIGRFDQPNDWLRHEIEFAMEHGRNIVPLLINDFKFDKRTMKYLTGKLADLPKFNGLRVPHEFFDEAMEKLRTRFLQEPISVTVSAAPPEEQPEVERRIEEAAAQPAPTVEQLSAEEYFNRAYARYDRGDYAGAIADYSEAIRLNPQYVAAYNNRGVARERKGDYDGAIADNDQAIRLNPQNASAYTNRGIARERKGDYAGAIADYDQAIRLNPQLAEAYSNRSIARAAKGDYDGSIADYDQAIRLNQDALAYYNRGNARQANGDLDGAIADFTESLRLKPLMADAYSSRGEAYFASELFDQAIEDFQQANRLLPANNVILGGLAITHHALGQTAKAKRLWRTLVAQDQRYRDADWVGKGSGWAKPLIEAARRLIAEL